MIASVCAAVLAAPQPAASAPQAQATPSVTATPIPVHASPGANLLPPLGDPGSLAPILVRGTLLTLARGYLVFTTGDAVKLADGLATPPGPVLGREVRATIDPVRAVVTALEFDPHEKSAQEIDAGALPRDVVTVDPASAQSAPQAAAQSSGKPVTLTLDVTVPDDTPPTDTIYLSTDRTNFNPSELRLNRVDAYRWTVALPLVSGTALHYQFTRGTSATVERDRTGALLVPRIQTLTTDAASHDVVARWADRT